MTTSIFLVTHAKDAEWTTYLFKSYIRYCTGFHEFVVAIERGQEGPFLKMGLTRQKIVIYDNPTNLDRYTNHLIAKMSADKWCSGDSIIYVDSDCIWIAPTTPETYWLDGKPLALWEDYERLKGAVPWQEPTEWFVGEKVKNEFMRRHPSNYLRRHLPLFRQHVEKVHGKQIPQLLQKMTRHSDPKRNVSEFNAIGAYLWSHQHDDYSWVFARGPIVPPSNLYQGWSMARADHPEEYGRIAWKQAMEMRTKYLS